MVLTINNCPVTVEYIRNANTIYGCNFPTLKRKTVFQQTKRAQAEYKEVTGILRESIRNLTVADDVIFVNIIPFLVIFLRGFNFTMVKYVSQRLNTVVANSTGKIFQFY